MSETYKDVTLVPGVSAENVNAVVRAETEMLYEILEHINHVRKNVKESELCWDSQSAKVERSVFFEENSFIENAEREITGHIKKLRDFTETESEKTQAKTMKKALCDDIFG